jgi:hypothetical protein
VSWRYRHAWLNARRRADHWRRTARAAQRYLDHWGRLVDEERALRVAAEDRVHLLEVGAAEDQERLIAAGRTITELQAALDLAVKGNPS